ncbi:hypothetical protein E2C01_017931 [Portunus trituberculatus]|uniref:Uncharacterized protein n=1 Tax=Portunus trituberculatus TaxID=210409 RepID=A0A5B7DUU8_PORTR|nr:hypothetical protein [Portunus trituberculatus]
MCPELSQSQIGHGHFKDNISQLRLSNEVVSKLRRTPASHATFLRLTCDHPKFPFLRWTRRKAEAWRAVNSKTRQESSGLTQPQALHGSVYTASGLGAATPFIIAAIFSPLIMAFCL